MSVFYYIFYWLLASWLPVSSMANFCVTFLEKNCLCKLKHLLSIVSFPARSWTVEWKVVVTKHDINRLLRQFSVQNLEYGIYVSPFPHIYVLNSSLVCFIWLVWFCSQYHSLWTLSHKLYQYLCYMLYILLDWQNTISVVKTRLWISLIHYRCHVLFN